MRKVVIIMFLLAVLGWIINDIRTPDYVKVNRQMVEQCRIDGGICD